MQIKDKNEFVRQMTANLPDRPAYFSYDVDVNLRGAKPLADVPMPKPLDDAGLNRAIKGGAVVLDTRSADEFGAGHLPGSINIGIGSASFSTWTGFMVSGEKPIVLVVRSEADADKARLELARIGFDNLVGYVLSDAVSQKQKLPQIDVDQLKASMKNGGPLVLDVRTPNEWKTKHIDGATHVPLSTFAKGLPALPKDKKIAVICGSGYRSSIASSLLQARGYDAVENVTGGMEAYADAEH